MAHDTMLSLSTVILLLPLLGFIILIFFGKRIGNFSSIFATAILGIDLLLSAIVAYNKLFVYGNLGMIQFKFNWIALGTKNVTIGIGIDNISALMLIVVTLISFLVHLFSIEYMSGDKRYPRFFAYLGLFTFSMLGIVIANNFLNMYIFWELVGISSYLLIGFWYEKDSASDASKKAFITNRIGDLGFFSGIMILYATYNTFMFDDIFKNIGMGNIPFGSGSILTITGILIFCGAIGKSAQFPLHVWLPDAMEGPTPVSALIHAATMVAAGVYMTARVFPMFTADALLFIAYIGAITAFISATIAITQNDFKRVLAYSTVSQLGYMIMGLGVGAFSVGFFHLVTHAWFKACLFLASGSVIHAMHHSMHHAGDHHTDPQDIRNMGGLRKTMPWTYLTFLMATLAISGVPFTSGFLSKDGILAGTLAFGQLTGHWLIPVIGFASAGMTAFYMFRLAIEAFHGDNKTPIAEHTKENKWVIVFPLVLLAVMSFWFFYSGNPLDASKGWFAEKTKAPATVVEARYQWDFLVPFNAKSTEQLRHEHLALNENAQHEINPEDEGYSDNQNKQTGQNKDINKVTSTENIPDETLGENHGEAHGEHHGMNKFEETMHEAHTPAMILSLLIAGCGMLFSFMVYQFKIFSADNLAKQFKPLYLFSFNKWYFDEFYDATVIWFTVNFSRLLGWFDNTIIDGIVNLTAAVTRVISYFVGHFDNIVIDGIVNLIANLTGFFGGIVRKLQTGSVQAYMILIIIGVMILLYFAA